MTLDPRRDEEGGKRGKNGFCRIYRSSMKTERPFANAFEGIRPPVDGQREEEGNWPNE
jgi:hypothetical protein